MTMRRLLPCIAASIVLLVAADSRAQDRGAPPRPGPEHARLGFFVGDWSVQSEIKAGPWGPGGKISGRDRCKWMEGRFFVICNTELEGDTGKLIGLGVLGYDPGSRRYVRAGFHSDGQAVLETGAVEGPTWTFSSDRAAGNNMTVRNRVVFTEKGPGRYDFRIELSPDGARWDTLVEGTAARR
jgi:hypothetical protein